ncbi:AGC/PDK1 protein kinase [Microdochium trichocladiopsis]|uniref:non-specific serine/threonine protein kinase n=1 Tax=Microdochium trichocladiopsis TaxID=1682393 RepID=A0A9P8YI66_9PEZI|nr:AGC/PDK1 protein kinase [Microdochium trichocladiopsis]KAH7040398.1 AGC/PDK1 protein kinase [Microdochium trichocladiopsis]
MTQSSEQSDQTATSAYKSQFDQPGDPSTFPQNGSNPYSSSAPRPVSAMYSVASAAERDQAANSYSALRNDNSRSSAYGAPSRSDSRSNATGYPNHIPSREPSYRERTYHADRSPPIGSGSGPLPPRRSSKGMGGGYASVPGVPYAPESRTPMPQEMQVSSGSEEWKDRGAAVSMRKEVDANGRTVMKPVKKGVRDFSFGRILGEGSYSTVYLATDRQTLKEYAIKVLGKKHIIKEKKIKYVNIEKDTLNRLTEHPGIVRLYYTFQDENSLYYVLDLCTGGELLGVLKKTGTFDEECTRFFGAQILDAIEYMHSRGVIHRDLKPENVLLDDQMHVKITDFGTARLLTDPRNPKPPGDPNSRGKEQDDNRAGSFVGTAEYVSPELLTNKNACKASDLWAFGCIIYQLLAGRPPFKAGSEYLTFQKIVSLEYEFPPGFPPAARDLVERCLVLDPARRLTIEHIKNHEFFDGQPFGKGLWKTKAPRLRPYVPPAQEPKVIQLNSVPTTAQAASASRQNLAGLNGNRTPGRIITDIPPPSQLDIEWSPVLSRTNERILRLGDLMVLSTPIANGPNGKDGDGHRKLSRFFGGSTTKKRQRLVMITSSGRIILAPAGGEEKKSKQEISLLASDCAWKTQIDAKGQTVWTVDSNGMHYTFEDAKAPSSLDSSRPTANDWIESLDQAKEFASNLSSSYGGDTGFGDMQSSMSSPASTFHGNRDFPAEGYSISDRSHRNHLSKSQASLDDTLPQKRNRFSKRQSKQGLQSAF